MKTLIAILVLTLVSSLSLAGEVEVIRLPEPKTDGGKPLLSVLRERKSTRQFQKKEIPVQVLSNLLWAAFGINRPESGKRTAPSAINWQETDIYVASAKGVHVYNAGKHQLDPVSNEDIRYMIGKQPFNKEVPVGLIYVTDFAKMAGTEEEYRKLNSYYSAADVGHISQNVYLFCTSEGLGTVALGLSDKVTLAKKLKLTKDQMIVLSQPVGYPKTN